ncbi:thaumatin [Spinellus fusiger]|nr:thaumatin [Spinellus fusiger]
MLNIVKVIVLPLLAIGSASMVSGATITVKNNCSYSSQINQQTNNAAPGTNAFVLAPGKSSNIYVADNWAGRVWPRPECTGKTDCDPPAPASLAEFNFGSFAGLTFFDVSLVDGFNVPLSVQPNGGTNCPSASCHKLPACPNGNQFKNINNNGKVVSCQNPNRDSGATTYAATTKKACPTVYTYSHDDNATLACKTNSFTVTLC